MQRYQGQLRAIVAEIAAARQYYVDLCCFASWTSAARFQCAPSSVGDLSG